jgi:hypothetical protein
VEPGVSQLVAALDSSEALWPSQQAPSPGRLHAVFLQDLGLDADDQAAVDAMVDARPETGLFVSKPWLSGYFNEPHPGTEYGLLLLRDARGLRGVVPLAIGETFTHARVRILGGGTGSDRVDLLAQRGFEATCADACLAWLQGTFGSRGFVLELRDVCASSSLWGAIHRSTSDHGQPLVMQPREIYTVPFLRLASEPRMPSGVPSEKTVRSVEKHRRWLERRSRIDVRLLTDVADAMAAYEDLVRFLRARWKDRSEGSALDEPRAGRFHRHVVPQLLAAGRLRMIRMTADGRTVAVFYGLAAGAWWGYYLAGYDREWAGRIHLGQVNLATAIEMAAAEGAAEFDFLKGAEPVKYVWPVRERTAIDADVFSRGCGVQLARASRATRDATAALSKSARALFCR